MLKLTTQSVSTSLTFQGPLPPPHLLEQYGKVIPNGPERILAMAESQLHHRQSLESAVVLNNVRAQTFGQWSAFVLGLVAIVGGTGLIAYDKDVEGLVSIVSALTALTGVYLYGRYDQAKERARKREEMKDAAAQGRLPLEPS